MKTLGSNFWKKYFQVYDSLNELIPYSALLSTIVEMLDIHDGDTVLDAGSGTGNLSILITQAGGKVVAFDSSQEGMALHRCKQPTAILINGDLMNPLPFDNSSFNKICSNNVIYTIPKKYRESLFREFYRILRPGGIIVVSNIRRNFSPTSIYGDHVRSSIRLYGLWRTTCNVVKLLFPIIRIFYYNLRIQSANHFHSYSFIDSGEQHSMLELAGFADISQDYKVYSDQAILNRAIKR